MAGRRAIKAINWAGLAERTSEADKVALAAFKARSDQCLRKVQEFPESQPKLDWAFYRTKVSIPGLVDKFQKELESLKIDYPVDKYTSQIEAQEKEVNAHVQKFIQESNQRIEENLKEITRLEGLLKYSQMTMEDFRDAHPDLAIDTYNRPTIWPHTEDCQPNGEEEKPSH